MTSTFYQAMHGMKSTADNFTDKTVNSVTAETKNTLNKLGDLIGESEQKLNSLSTNLTQTVSGLDEVTTKIKTSVLEATGGAVNTLTDASNRAASIVKETTDKTTGVLNETTNVAVHRINDATNSIAQTAEKTKLVLDETLQKTEQLSGAISNSVQDVIVTSVKMWMAKHPLLSWMLIHPLWAIALILLTLFLGWGLFAAISQSTQQAWLFILRTPLKLARFLHGKAFQLFQRADMPQLTRLPSQQEIQKRLPEILNRLERLRQEQDELMKEMQSILFLRAEK